MNRAHPAPHTPCAHRCCQDAGPGSKANPPTAQHNNLPARNVPGDTLLQGASYWFSSIVTARRFCAQQASIPATQSGFSLP